MKVFLCKIYVRYVYIDCVNLIYGLVVCVGVEVGDVKGDYVIGISDYYFCMYIMYVYMYMWLFYMFRRLFML